MSENTLVSLTHNINDMLAIVSNYKSEEMKMIFVKLSALEAALRAADMFYEASVKYAQLEAYALIRAVELSNGKLPELSGKNRTLRAEAAVWLYNMNEKERNYVISLCEKGKTICSVYSKLTAPSPEEKASKIKQKLKKTVLNNLEKDGICRLNTPDIETYLRSVPSNLRSDVRNGIRKILLDKGAVGLHDNKGTYILPASSSDKVYEALEARINSIEQDFTSFLDIAGKCKTKPIFNIISKGAQNAYSRHYILLLAAYYNAITFSASPHIAQQIRNTLKDMIRFLNLPVPTCMGGEYIDVNRLNIYFADDLQATANEYKKYEKSLSSLYPVIEKLAFLATVKNINEDKMKKIIEILNSK